MLTILGIINQYVGFFNVNTKFKGRLYTVLGFLGDWYILYVAISFLTAHRYLRGSALVAAFCCLMYVIYINFMYYFTEKKAKFDISPKFEKIIGSPQQPTINPDQQSAAISSNGLYHEQQVLPTLVQMNADEKDNLQTVASQMLELNLISENYQNLTDDEIKNQLMLNDNRPVFANYPGTTIPFAKLIMEGENLVVYGGINEMQALRLGKIARVGLANVSDALKNANVYLASIVVLGGKAKTLARSSFIETDYPFTLKIEVAYQLK